MCGVQFLDVRENLRSNGAGNLFTELLNVNVRRHACVRRSEAQR
jgi:hypothetical protein